MCLVIIWINIRVGYTQQKTAAHYSGKKSVFKVQIKPNFMRHNYYYVLSS